MQPLKIERNFEGKRNPDDSVAGRLAMAASYGCLSLLSVAFIVFVIMLVVGR